MNYLLNPFVIYIIAGYFASAFICYVIVKAENKDEPKSAQINKAPMAFLFTFWVIWPVALLTTIGLLGKYYGWKVIKFIFCGERFGRIAQNSYVFVARILTKPFEAFIDRDSGF